MHTKLLTLTLALATTAALTNAYDLGAIQQLIASPAVQGQMAQTVAANPGLAAGMFSNLSPSQTAVLTTRLQAITDKALTPAEKTKLTEFQSSPEGASILGKLPGIVEQLAPVLMEVYMSPDPLPVAPKPATPTPSKK